MRIRAKYLTMAATSLAIMSFGLGANVHAALTNCPAHVKVAASIGDATKLSLDGIFCYKDNAGELYFSSIKSYSAKKAPVDAKGLGRITFSPDGKWVFGLLGNGDLACVKTDASTVWKLGVKGGQCGFYFHSPKEKADQKLYEVAYIDYPALNVVWAQLIDFSGAQPKLVGTRRKLGDGLPKAGGTYGEEFSVAGRHFAWDSRVIKTEGPSVVYTIPDDGNGIATSAMYYKVYNTFNCATALEQTGKLWVTNWGRLYDSRYPDCIPCSQGWHTGFAVMKTRLNTAPLVKATEYVMDTAKGAVSVNWPMETFQGQKTRWLHSDGDKAAASAAGVAEFFPGPWTNHEDYMTVSMSKGNPENKLFLLQWKTNTWYPLTPKGVPSSGGAVWFEGQTYPRLTTAARAGGSYNPGHGRTALLSAFRDISRRDIIGRNVISRTRGAAGIRVSRNMVTPALK